jgi:hypothetical protein
MPQVNSSVTHNYNRVLTPFSRFGTRRVEAYRIVVSDITDASAIYVDYGSLPNFPTYLEYADYVEANYGITLIVGDTYHEDIQFPSNSIYSGIIAGVGEVAEIYYVGQFTQDHFGTDNNTISITVMVASETFVDAENPDFNEHSRNMLCAIYKRIEQFDFIDLAVDRVELYGDGFVNAFDARTQSQVGGGYAMPHTKSRELSEPVKVSKASLAPKK